MTISTQNLSHSGRNMDFRQYTLARLKYMFRSFLFLAVFAFALATPMSASAAFRQTDRFTQTYKTSSPGTEVCTDAADNDGDGQVDEAPCVSISQHIASRDVATDSLGESFVIEGTDVVHYGTNNVRANARGFGDAQGIDVGTSGKVYVTGGSGQVAEFTNTLGLIRSWTRGSTLSNLARSQREVAIAVSEESDALYTASEHSVERYTLSEAPNVFTNRKTATSTLLPSGAGSSFESVRAIEVDGSGRVFVLDGTEVGNRLYRFSAAGVLQTSFPVPGYGVAHGLAVSSSNRIFVSTFNDSARSTSCVVELSATGTQVTAFGGRVGRPGWFNQGFGLGVTPGGDLIVASAFEMVRFSESGGGVTPDDCSQGGL